MGKGIDVREGIGNGKEKEKEKGEIDMGRGRKKGKGDLKGERGRLRDRKWEEKG